MTRIYAALVFCTLLSSSPAQAGKRERVVEPPPLDRYIQEALARQEEPGSRAPGSAWVTGSSFLDLASDLRARRVDDIVTIQVSERASAVTKGTTKTSRQSNAKSSVGALAGVTRATGPLANLAQFGGQTQLDGEGTTTRETNVTATLSARVTHVLPNGYLVVEGVKETQINSERQVISVRGVVRPSDLSPANIVTTDRLAQLEVRINGKGVVADAIRRPYFLYRLFTGLLPF